MFRFKLGSYTPSTTTEAHSQRENLAMALSQKQYQPEQLCTSVIKQPSSLRA